MNPRPSPILPAAGLLLGCLLLSACGKDDAGNGGRAMPAVAVTTQPGSRTACSGVATLKKEKQSRGASQSATRASLLFLSFSGAMGEFCMKSPSSTAPTLARDTAYMTSGTLEAAHSSTIT